MSQPVQYGPYTPQEVERIVLWLQNQKIQFELIKDSETEKISLMNDGLNLVALAEWRTQVYLGQIYYVQIAFESDQLKQQFEQKFWAVIEQFKNQIQSLQSEEEDQKKLHQSAVKQKNKQRVLALLLVLVIILFFLKSYFS